MVKEKNRSNQLEIHLFGTFEVKVNGNPVPLHLLHSRHGQYLLALLTLEPGHSLTRAWLANTLWPDQTLEDARRSLRTELSHLRRALGDEGKRLVGTSVLRLELADAYADVVAFHEAIERGKLEEAITHYRGSLLKGWAANWVEDEREKHANIWRGWAQHELEHHKPSEALDYVSKALDLTPLKEDLLRLKLRALAACGNYPAVAQSYAEYRKRLIEEYKVEPEPETTELYDQLCRPPVRSNIPVPSTPLIGREEEIEAVRGLLLKRRFLTLTGTGGIGKTRLAIGVMKELEDEFQGAVWFVPLETVQWDAHVFQQVASTLGVEEASSCRKALFDFLRPKRALLILDSCEHLLEGCRALIQELQPNNCHEVFILAVSRQPLALSGEHRWGVPPLKEDEAVALFSARAIASNSRLRGTKKQLVAIQQVCQCLEDIPLAIELASAWVDTLSIQQIRDQLRKRFELLVGGRRDMPLRHQTMDAAIEWSYHLLSHAAQYLLLQLSVFRGGWPLDAVESVCVGENLRAALKDKPLLPVLAELVEKSLVIFDSDQGRYRMLEVIRVYGEKRLKKLQENDEVTKAHYCFCLHLAQKAATNLQRNAKEADLIEVEHGNLRAALARCVTGDQIEQGLRLANVLSGFWEMRGYFSEGREFLGELLSRDGKQILGEVRADALKHAGNLAKNQGDYAAATKLYQESLDIYVHMQDDESIPKLRANLANIAFSQGEYKTARKMYAVICRIFKKKRDCINVARACVNEAGATYRLKKYRATRILLEVALRIRREVPDQQGIASVLLTLGCVAFDTRSYSDARIYWNEVLAISQELILPKQIADARLNLLTLDRTEGNVDIYDILKVLQIFQNLGDRPSIANTLELLGETYDTLNHKVLAVRLLSKAQVLRREMGRSSRDAEPIESLLSKLRVELGMASYQVAWESGAIMSIEEVLQAIQ